VQSDGQRVHTPNFVVMVRAGSPQRLGITVTRRVAGAVGRNRVKRLVREVFRRNRKLFPERCELVLVARASALRLDYDALRRELAQAQAAMFRAARRGASGAPGAAESQP
jgi:ribonuclease P protein component